ncbi:MAG: hypothetical protein ACKOW2_01615 [Sphingobacteriaceae bacterium]
MEAVELKSNIHKIVDGIQNEQLLQSLYDFLKLRAEAQPGQLWSKLSAEQQKELLLSFEESDDENHLLEREKVFKKL